MNINLIGKEFEKLEEVDNYINYEFEPKTNIKYGKRNIFFDEIKHEFINDVNIYGFSPYILQSFAEQRDNPNINKFIKKKFNYGYTNYIKIKAKNSLPFSSRLHKKLKIKSNNKDKNDALKLIPDIFLIRKEKQKDIKIEEEKGNFLKKALGKMGGNHFYINNEEIDKKKEKTVRIKKDNTVNNINNLKRRRGRNNMELIKDILIINEKKEKNKSLSFNNIDLFGNQTKNNTKLKIKNIKHFFENIKKNLNSNQSEKNVLTLTKNKYILGNKRLFSSFSTRNAKSVETASVSNRKKKHSKRISTVEIPKNLIRENKNKFLLFTKAIPYKYLGMSYSRTNK